MTNAIFASYVLNMFLLTGGKRVVMLYGGNVDADQPVLWCTLICILLALLLNPEIWYKCIDREGPGLTVWICRRFGPSLFIYGIRSLFSWHVLLLFFSLQMSWIFEGIKRNKKQPPVPCFRPLRMDRYILLIVKCSVRYVVSEEKSIQVSELLVPPILDHEVPGSG